MAALNRYLAGQELDLRLPTHIRTTAFQMKVWRYLQSIPYGSVQSYQEGAAGIGEPRAGRAVARALATGNGGERSVVFGFYLRTARVDSPVRRRGAFVEATPFRAVRQKPGPHPCRWLLYLPVVVAAQTIPNGAAIDAEVRKIMTNTHAKGMAVAVIDHGKVGYIHAYGIRDTKGDLLTADTVMYGASLTKTVFAYTVMQLVDHGKLNLDTPLKDDLDKTLPSYGPDPVFPDKYGPYKDLAGDSRWEKITPRMCLTHSTGFSNFWFIEPDQKLHIHFEPGTRFSYSGEGFILLQFVIEHGRKAQGLGLDVGDLTKGNFDRMGMTRTSLVWHDGLETNVADGWNDQGQPQAHDQRSKVRVAGSMNTTLSDLSKFAAALVNGDGLSAASRAQMTKPRLHITTAHQFPLFLPDLPLIEQRKDLYSGLGVTVFDGTQGPGFYKGGHDGQTANTLVCIEASQRCVVILSNDVRSEAGFADLVRFILGDTGVPYEWEYGDHAGKS